MCLDPILANMFLRTFPCFLLTFTSTILILISILVFCFMFVFPLLRDKQTFKFRGVAATTTFFQQPLCFSSFSVVATIEYSRSRPRNDLQPNISFSPFSTHSQEAIK